jgi:coenzyme F420-reducing hydrogenase delta subunit
MKKFFVPALALLTLASCDYTRPTLLGTNKRPHNCKRIIRPLCEGVVYASYIDTAYKAGDTIRVAYTHDETRAAVVIR